MRQLTLLLLMLTLSLTASAKLYKWVDADGNVTYSERKPPDSKVEEVKLRGVQAVSAEEVGAQADVTGGGVAAVANGREGRQDLRPVLGMEHAGDRHGRRGCWLAAEEVAQATRRVDHGTVVADQQDVVEPGMTVLEGVGSRVLRDVEHGLGLPSPQPTPLLEQLFYNNATIVFDVRCHRWPHGDTAARRHEKGEAQ